LAFALNQAEEIADIALEEFGNDPTLVTVNDVIGKVNDELEQAGIDVEKVDNEKIAKMIKEKTDSKEGFDVKFNPNKNKYEIEYNKKF
jgi:predicted methyltransferase MtxX (methanogen marker protein 4)